MKQSEAEIKLRKYTKAEYGEIEILSTRKVKNLLLFEFKSIGDECPIDYPMIGIDESGKIRELSFLNPKDRDLIFGR